MEVGTSWAAPAREYDPLEIVEQPAREGPRHRSRRTTYKLQLVGLTAFAVCLGSAAVVGVICTPIWLGAPPPGRDPAAATGHDRTSQHMATRVNVPPAEIANCTVHAHLDPLGYLRSNRRSRVIAMVGLQPMQPTLNRGALEQLEDCVAYCCAGRPRPTNACAACACAACERTALACRACSPACGAVWPLARAHKHTHTRARAPPAPLARRLALPLLLLYAELPPRRRLPLRPRRRLLHPVGHRGVSRGRAPRTAPNSPHAPPAAPPQTAAAHARCLPPRTARPPPTPLARRPYTRSSSTAVSGPGACG